MERYEIVSKIKKIALFKVPIYDRNLDGQAIYYTPDGRVWIEDTLGHCKAALAWKYDGETQLIYHKYLNGGDDTWTVAGKQYQKAYTEYVSRLINKTIIDE